MSDIPNWKQLSEAERSLVETFNKDPDTYNHAVLIESLKAHLQVAVEIELATIPIYLYTYYSLHRAADTASDPQGTMIEKYVNEAGGVIMSVAVEEMLHMSLAGNILNSLGQHPVIYGKSPDLPGPLPLHANDGGKDGKQRIEFHLKKFSWAHLFQFLQIELPEAFDADPEGDLVPIVEGGKGWDTIGQFYSYIRCLIHAKLVTDADFQQICQSQQLGDDNYAPNNIDTVFPDDPGFSRSEVPLADGSAAKAAVYPNNGESHEGNAVLLQIDSKDTALQAIATICDEGEGYQHTDTDDSEANEDSHFIKFYSLRGWLQPDAGDGLRLDPDKISVPLPPDPTPEPPLHLITELELECYRGVSSLFAFPDNPRTISYPSAFQDLSNLCNAIYQYMLLLTQMSYQVSDARQKAIFNIGMHKAMIWILDKIIQGMRENCNLPGGTVLAPTFENYQFATEPGNERELLDPKREMLDLCKKIEIDHPEQFKLVVGGYDIPNLIGDLPDVKLRTYQRGPRKGEKYVSFATPANSL